jgi:hypothetical protein
LWPDDPDRRMLVWLLLVPLLLPLLTLPPFGISITSLWTMPAWFLLPIVLLAPPEIQLARAAAVRVALIVLAVTVACLAASPGLAWYRHINEGKEERAYYREVGEKVTKLWHNTIGKPLTIVMGDQDLAIATTFYSVDHPDGVPGFDLATAPWVTPERLAREGFAAVCLAADNACVKTAEKRAPGPTTRLERDVVNVLLGVPGVPGRFIFVLSPPKP